MTSRMARGPGRQGEGYIIWLVCRMLPDLLAIHIYIYLLHRAGPDRRATLMRHDVFMRGDSEACNKVPRTPPHTKGTTPYESSQRSRRAMAAQTAVPTAP